MDQSPPTLQMAMAIIISVFDEHASKDGDKITLCKKEVKELLQTQFKGILGDCSDPKKLDEVFSSLDVNSDDAVDFQEFMVTVTCLTMGLYDLIKDARK